MIITLCTLFFILYFLAFGLFLIPSQVYQYIYNTDLRALLILGLIFAFLILYGLANSEIPWERSQNTKFGKYIFSFFAIVILEVIYSKFKYGQSFASFGKLVYFYPILVVYFVFYYLIDTRDKLERIKYVLLVLLFLSRSYDLIMRLVLSRSGFSTFYFDIIAFPFICVGVLFRKSEHRGLCIATGILQIISYLLVYDNDAIRLIIVAVLLSCVISKLIAYNGGITKTFIQICIIVLAVLFVLNIWSWLAQWGDSDVSVGVRILAIQYYFEKLVDSPLLGWGFIDTSWGAYYTNLLMGGLNELGGINQFYLDDIGIVGFAFQFGLVGIIWFVLLFKKMTETVRNLDVYHRTENIGELVVVVMLCISLWPLSKTEIAIFPLILILLEKNAEFYCGDSLNQMEDLEYVR